jgi:hypothetical protein
MRRVRLHLAPPPDVLDAVTAVQFVAALIGVIALVLVLSLRA